MATTSRPVFLVGVLVGLLALVCGVLVHLAAGPGVHPPHQAARDELLHAHTHATLASSSSASSVPTRPDLAGSVADLTASLTAYSHAFNPLGHEGDRAVVIEERARIDSALQELRTGVDAIIAGDRSASSLDGDTLRQLRSVPLHALRANIRQRSGVIKEMLAYELHGRDTLTFDDIDAYARRPSDLLGPEGFLLHPLKRLIDHHRYFCWLAPPTPDAVGEAGSSQSALEFAVETMQTEAVQMILQALGQGSQADGGSADPCAANQHVSRLSALQLAENNYDTAMQQLLQRTRDSRLFVATLTPELQATRAAHLSIKPSSRPSPSAERSAFLRAAGGWRSSTGQLQSLAHLFDEDKDASRCPFPRLSLVDLTPEVVRAHFVNRRPLIVTDALSPEWAISAQLTRARVARDWAHVNVSAGAIPYGDHFATKTGRVTFDEFLEYMDHTHRRQASQPAPSRATLAAAARQPPYYIFDYAMFQQWRWNLMPKPHQQQQQQQQQQQEEEEATKTEATENEKSPSEKRKRNPDVEWSRMSEGDFYTLPRALLGSFSGSSSESFAQFYLGPEESGAPFHFHCPAWNMLVYGEKLWWLHPPAVGLYSKRAPLAFILDQQQLAGEQEPTDGPGLHPRLPTGFTCVQRRGDLFLVPTGWSHATLNTRETIGVAVEIDVGAC